MTIPSRRCLLLFAGAALLLALSPDASMAAALAVLALGMADALLVKPLDAEGLALSHPRRLRQGERGALVVRLFSRAWRPVRLQFELDVARGLAGETTDARRVATVRPRAPVLVAIELVANERGRHPPPVLHVR